MNHWGKIERNHEYEDSNDSASTPDSLVPHVIWPKTVFSLRTSQLDSQHAPWISRCRWNSSISWILLPLIGLFFTLLIFCYFHQRAKLDINGKYILIAGCDYGFGSATAIALDKMGVYVLATCLTKEGEQSLKSTTNDTLRTFQLHVRWPKHFCHLPIMVNG